MTTATDEENHDEQQQQQQPTPSVTCLAHKLKTWNPLLEHQTWRVIAWPHPEILVMDHACNQEGYWTPERRHVLRLYNEAMARSNAIQERWRLFWPLVFAHLKEHQLCSWIPMESSWRAIET